MLVPQKAIKRLIETGGAVDITCAENWKKPRQFTVIYYSVGVSGVNGAALLDRTMARFTQRLAIVQTYF